MPVRSAAAGPGARIVVNADDYGYFPGVTEGILDCVRQGRVTAVGAMPHRPGFERDAARLLDEVDVDAGVHLVLTEGTPLTPALASALPGGAFPPKMRVVGAVLRKSIGLAMVRDEWRAQIERCLACGLRLRFLNSHEHIHMLPPLFDIVCALAREYGIGHIRLSTPERPSRWQTSSVARDLGLGMLSRVNRAKLARPALPFLGMSVSGRLDVPYLRQLLATLGASASCELMCHPGRKLPGATVDPALLGYHDWGGEITALCSPEFGSLLERHGARLVGYRDLDDDIGSGTLQ